MGILSTLPDKPSNVVQSVRDRLLHRKQKTGENYETSHYGLKRILYRLGESSFHDQYVLKGAYVFLQWRIRPFAADPQLSSKAIVVCKRALVFFRPLYSLQEASCVHGLRA
jgi:hypothetical protein